MAISRSSLLAFGITVALGSGAVAAARVALRSEAGAPAAANDVDRRPAEATPVGRAPRAAPAEASAPPGRSLDEMMAEHERLRTALRDAEASGDGAALAAAVEASRGRFRDPASIVEHAAFSAIALCRTGALDEGQRLASLWIQSEGQHPLRPKVESACAGPTSETKPAAGPAARP